VDKLRAFSVTSDGMRIDSYLYSIDIKKKIFICYESHLTLDFSNFDSWIFQLGNNCIIRAGTSCTFDTGNRCTFYSRWYSTFNTGNRCSFLMVGGKSSFNTGNECIFRVTKECTFDTGSNCSFILQDILTHTFKKFDDLSIILDIKSGSRYVLNEELIKLTKIGKV